MINNSVSVCSSQSERNFAQFSSGQFFAALPLPGCTANTSRFSSFGLVGDNRKFGTLHAIEPPKNSTVRNNTIAAASPVPSAGR